MIVRDRCLILHMPKTGGVFIRMLLEKHYGDAVMLPSGNSFDDPSAPWAQHHSIDDVPVEFRRLPAVGFVRNPWDWYVSWYHFFTSYPYKPPHFMSVSQNKTLDFAGFMEAVFSLPVDSEEYIYNSYAAKYYRIFAATAQAPRNPEIEMGFFESVHDDLYRFLDRIGFDRECLDDIEGFRRINPSKHRHYSTYYTDTLVQQVYEHTKPIIEEFDYRFENR
jgi:hypothetical protein